MTQTYGPYFIITYPPVDNTLVCSDNLEPKYAIVNNKTLELKDYRELTFGIIDDAFFYFEPQYAGLDPIEGATGSKGLTATFAQYIYNSNKDENLYWSNNNANLAKVELEKAQFKLPYALFKDDGNFGLTEISTNGVVSPQDNVYIRSLDNFKLWINNNNGSQDYDNNFLFMKDYDNNLPSEAQYPLCISRFSIQEVPIQTTAILSSTNTQLQANNIKMRKIINDNFINLDIFKSNCVFEKGNIKCNRERENLLSVYGYKVEPEPCFHTTYKVRIRVNKNIVKQKCEEHRLSFYNLDENYTVVKFRNQHTLITNAITPVCSKINQMVAKMNIFISKCQQSKCQKSKCQKCKCQKSSKCQKSKCQQSKCGCSNK